MSNNRCDAANNLTTDVMQLQLKYKIYYKIKTKAKITYRLVLIKLCIK